jgi:hypothetical protein
MAAAPCAPAASMAAFVASLPPPLAGGFKVIGFNVNGLRGALDKPGAAAALRAWLDAERCDVLTLSEIKVDAAAAAAARLGDAFPALPHARFACGEKKGYAGVALYSRAPPLSWSTGVGAALLGRPVEDTIALLAEWENVPSGARGTAVYTASWAAPPADVHSQQRFHCMGHGGEVTVDQAHRGYAVATDAAGFSSQNPLFFRYTPCDGRFAGQQSYGYRSIEDFILAVQKIAAGAAAARDFDASLATVHTTQQGTAILEAGRVSLDSGGAAVDIVYADGGLHPTALKLRTAAA